MKSKKEISIDKGDLYLIKMAFGLLLIMAPFVIYSLTSETDNKFEKLIYIVIYSSAGAFIFRFLWFAKHVSFDESHFLISGLFKKYGLPIESLVKIEPTFLTWIQRFPQIKLRFALSGGNNKLVILIPGGTAQDIINQLNEIKELRLKKREK
jgi:hypothetical protein